MTGKNAMRILIGLGLLLWVTFASPLQALAVPVFGGEVFADAVGCQVVDTCPPDAFITDSNVVQQLPPTPSPVSISTSAAAPGASASVSLENNSGGITAMGEGAGVNDGHAVDEPGFQGSSEFFAVAVHRFILSGPPAGTVVTLTARLSFPEP